MGEKLYDFLKWVALVLLPALGTFYFAVGQIWHFPAIEEVVGTIAAVDTFLGLLISKSSKDFKRDNEKPEFKGDIIVRQDPDGVVEGMRFVAYEDPFILNDGKNVLFNIKRERGSTDSHQ